MHVHLTFTLLGFNKAKEMGARLITAVQSLFLFKLA